MTVVDILFPTICLSFNSTYSKKLCNLYHKLNLISSKDEYFTRLEIFVDKLWYYTFSV